jgi:tripartite-type tricarboxylate transporter receptor subunit TctC
VLLPAGTSKEIINVLHREIVAILNEPESKVRLMALGYEPVASTPDEFRQRIVDELELWNGVVRRTNTKLQ